MPKRDDAKHRARYTLEFKLEAVRLVKSGQEASVTTRVLGIPKATLSNWVRACEKGVPQGAGDKPVNAEQMALARLRAELGTQRQVAATRQACRHPCTEHKVHRTWSVKPNQSKPHGLIACQTPCVFLQEVADPANQPQTYNPPHATQHRPRSRSRFRNHWSRSPKYAPW